MAKMNKWINIKQVLVGSSQNVLAKARTITFRLTILIFNVDYEHPMCKEESQYNLMVEFVLNICWMDEICN